MAGTKELKDRIKSVRETRKITNAMHLIASTKLRRAKSDLAQTRPFFEMLQREVAEMFGGDSQWQGYYFSDKDGNPIREGSAGLLVITADKGLAGAYNVNVLRRAEQLMAKRPDTLLFVVGEYGKRYFSNHKVNLAEGFDYPATKPTVETAREMADRILRFYDRGKINDLHIIYTDMGNGVEIAQTHRLLPLDRKLLEGQKAHRYEFLPSREEVFAMVLRTYLSGFIYSALVDSFCSEQNARVTAMDAANRNAEELLGDLSLQLNRKRQAAITQEITEISAGAKAQQMTGKKEAPTV